MRTWPCCYTTGNSDSDSWPCVLCPLPQWQTPEWWLHSRQKKKGCAFLLTFPAPCHQQWTRFVLWLRCQNRRNVRTIVELPRPKFSAARRSTLILAHLHSDASDGLEQILQQDFVTKKKNLHLWILTSSVLWQSWAVRLVYRKMYLTSSSSPPPTLWTFIMVSTEAQPQVFSTFSCCPRLSSEKLFWKQPSTPARQRLSTSLHFQTSAFATDLVPVLSALVAESTVGTLVWGRNGHECLVWQTAALRLVYQGEWCLPVLNLLLPIETFSDTWMVTLQPLWPYCVCMWAERYGSIDTLHILFSETG